MDCAEGLHTSGYNRYRRELKRLLLISLLANAAVVFGQLVVVPIGSGSREQNFRKSNTRIQSDQPLTLPFWDDFSFTKASDPEVPMDTLWDEGRSVWVNDGIGINPPSIYTATFDGIDQTGKPYNITDIQAKGFADQLVSRAIDLSTLPATQQDSVFISFFYQVTGRGEAPDKDDNFSLWFKDVNGTWEKVFEVGNSVDIDPTKFNYKILKVDSKYFHDQFQFKFQNFARLSGPYDTWNLDYVYLNKRRKDTDIYFHDQSLTKPISSIFKQYRAIPIKHFKDTASSLLIAPTAGFYNLYKFAAQSFKYSTSAHIVDKMDDVETVQDVDIEVEGDPQTVLPNFTHLDLQLAETVPLSAINLSADSIVIDFKLGFDSGDKNIVPETPFFQPIDFTLNDTVRAEFILHKHYAYDDGTAEYGAGLNKTGTEMAYQFDMYTKASDTIVAVYLYWPQFGDNSNQTVILKIWNDIQGKPSSILYGQTLTVQRTQYNTFTRYNLSEPVAVKNRFYVGWEQTGATVVPVGYDKNNNSGDKIFVNITGTWEQDPNLTGSLMIRPVFGKGDGVIISGVEKPKVADIYPNPNQGRFSIPLDAENISLFNMMGSPIEFFAEKTTDSQVVTIAYPQPGIYIIRLTLDKKQETARIWVSN